MLILDAYNVLHAAPRVDPGLGGLTLASLAALLSASRYQAGGVLLVCDGSSGRTRVGDDLLHPEAPVRVVFAGPGKDADAAIQRLIMEEEHKGRAGALTVVSSDKGVLASAIGPFGPKPRRMTSEQLLRTLLDDAARESRGRPDTPAAKLDPLDDQATDRWLREFGIDPAPRVPRFSEPGSSSASSSSSSNTPTTPTANNIPGSKNRAAEPPGSKNQDPQDWPDGINPDDLDMRKWLKEEPRNPS